ncbi:amidase family protein [Pseudothauera rhizosphaerae]|uniref:Amidase n=1 Tax=Pseudothauera rhizosphaerae TaxID=2565932 RepID=A0A4S4AZW9_9RHOO|nr:amidase family protein [Pseudothauera rhizosphaerae]THF65299.1 amidase [Pseudothauera rhizosphaerae]
MSTHPDLWRLSAAEIAALVHRRDVSAEAIASAALARLEEANPAINAIVEHRPEETLARARAVDRALARGEAVGPLAGVPVTIKINLDQAGYATSNGLRTQRDLVARENNPVVDGLLASGAVPLGRSNAPAFSYRWFTDNLLHGATRNPRNPALTPGGSSGGAAAALAVGIGAIAHGSDIAGSIRYPAYASGVHGLRPTPGRVAVHNATAVQGRSIGVQIMAVSGPLARTVADLRLGLHAMARPDVRDPWWVPAPLQGPPVPHRAALCLAPDGMDTAAEIRAALLDAADKLRDAGWTVDEVDALPPLREAVPIQIALWMGGDYDNLLAAARREGDPGAIDALAGQEDFIRGLGLQDYARALTRREIVARAWALFVERYPVVLLPNSAELPFPDGLDLQGPEAYRRVWNAQLPMIALPVTGLPALTLSTGLLRDGTPVGVQIVAGRFREDLCLEAAAAIEARGAAIPLAAAPPLPQSVS